MTHPNYRHPVASLWQAVTNAVEVPPRTEQRDVHPPASVRARYVWALDGEVWIEARVMAVWERRGHEDVVLVHRVHRDARAQTRGVWLRARDVERVAPLDVP